MLYELISTAVLGLAFVNGQGIFEETGSGGDAGGSGSDGDRDYMDPCKMIHNPADCLAVESRERFECAWFVPRDTEYCWGCEDETLDYCNWSNGGMCMYTDGERPMCGHCSNAYRDNFEDSYFTCGEIAEYYEDEGYHVYCDGADTTVPDYVSEYCWNARTPYNQTMRCNDGCDQEYGEQCRADDTCIGIIDRVMNESSVYEEDCDRHVNYYDNSSNTDGWDDNRDWCEQNCPGKFDSWDDEYGAGYECRDSEIHFFHQECTTHDGQVMDDARTDACAIIKNYMSCESMRCSNDRCERHCGDEMLACLFTEPCYEEWKDFEAAISEFEWDEMNPMMRPAAEAEAQRVCDDRGGCSDEFWAYIECGKTNCAGGGCMARECADQVDRCYADDMCTSELWRTIDALDDGDDEDHMETTAEPLRRRLLQDGKASTTQEPCYDCADDGQYRNDDDHHREVESGANQAYYMNIIRWWYTDNCTNDVNYECNGNLTSMLDCAIDSERCEYVGRAGSCPGHFCWDEMVACFEDSRCGGEMYEFIQWSDKCEHADELSEDEYAECYGWRDDYDVTSNGEEDGMEVQYFQHECWDEDGCSDLYSAWWKCAGTNCFLTKDDDGTDGADNGECTSLCADVIADCMFNQTCYESVNAFFQMNETLVGEWVEEQAFSGEGFSDESYREFISEVVCTTEEVTCTAEFWAVVDCVWTNCIYTSLPCWMRECGDEVATCFADDTCRTQADTAFGSDDGTTRRRMQSGAVQEESAQSDGDDFLPMGLTNEEAAQWRADVLATCGSSCSTNFVAVVDCFEGCVTEGGPDEDSDGDDGKNDGSDAAAFSMATAFVAVVVAGIAQA